MTTELEAGRKTDVIIAKLLGWRVESVNGAHTNLPGWILYDKEGKHCGWFKNNPFEGDEIEHARLCRIPHYSTDLVTAFQMLEDLYPQGYEYNIERNLDIFNRWCVRITRFWIGNRRDEQGYGSCEKLEDLALAICRALYQVLSKE